MGRLVHYPAPDRVRLVELWSDEVTTVCPRLGHPDFYTVQIRYVPAETIVCTKSLKEWFGAQRVEGYSAERFAQVIYELIEKEIDPIFLRVDVTQKARGGIRLTATCGAIRE